MKIQCLFYALDKINNEGGYIVFRKSTHWCMPHVLHYNPIQNRLSHYVPPADLPSPWYSMFGFDGYVKVGDSEVCPPMSPTCMFFGTLALGIFGLIWLVNRKKIHQLCQTVQVQN